MWVVDPAIDLVFVCIAEPEVRKLLQLQLRRANLGTEEYPSNVAKEESYQTDVDEASFIDTPQGYYIPPGCTNGFYYRAEYVGKLVNTKVCYNSKRVSSIETPA